MSNQVVSVEEIKQYDLAYKSNEVNEQSMQLGALWEDCSKHLTRSFLGKLGLGNRKNADNPLEVSIVKRVIDALTVVYSTAATRILADGQEEYDDDDPIMQAATAAWKRSSYDLIWQRADSARNLWRTCVLEWNEDHANRCVGAVVYGPHQVFRNCSVSSPHAIQEDKEVLLQIRWSMNPQENLYRAYVRGDSSWYCWIVNESGHMPEDVEQPYGESGECPLGSLLPIQVLTDEYPGFRAWLPIPQSRVSWALGINGIVNDTNFLVQMEAHSQLAIQTDAKAESIPTAQGPDKVWIVPSDSKVERLASSPKIAESIEVAKHLTTLFATSEYLPGDIFDASHTPHTGQALKVANHSLALRRQRQLMLVEPQEREAWRIYSALHNVYASEWGMKPLLESADVHVYPAKTWLPIDQKEAQELMYKDLMAGLKSRVMAVQELYGLTREQAIQHLKRVEKDRAQYPADGYESPGALIADSGPRAALGEGSATPLGSLNEKMPDGSITSAIAAKPYASKP